MEAMIREREQAIQEYRPEVQGFASMRRRSGGDRPEEAAETGGREDGCCLEKGGLGVMNSANARGGLP